MSDYAGTEGNPLASPLAPTPDLMGAIAPSPLSAPATTPVDLPPAITPYEQLQDHFFDSRQAHLLMQQRIDDRARAKIQADLQQSQDQEAGLLQKLHEAGQAFTAPPPRPTSLTMSPAEMWAAGLGGVLMGGKFGQTDNMAADAASHRQELEYQNAAAANQFQNQGAARGYDLAGHQYTSQVASRHQLEAEQAAAEKGFAADEGRAFGQDVTDQRYLRNEGEKLGNQLRDEYEHARTPGDADTAARRLEAFDRDHGTKYAPSPEEKAAKVGVMAQQAVNHYQAGVTSLWRYSTAVNPADQAAMEQERQGILAMYPGLDPRRLPPVPTSQAIGAARIQEQKRQFGERMQLAKDRFAWVKGNAAEHLQVAWAGLQIASENHEVALQNMRTGQDRLALSAAQTYLNQIDNGSSDIVDEASKKLRDVEAKLAGAQALANSNGVSFKKMGAKAEAAKLTGERDKWKQVIDEANTTRSTSGLAPLSPDQIMQQGRSMVGQRPTGGAPAPILYSGGHDPNGKITVGGQQRSIGEAIQIANSLLAQGHDRATVIQNLAKLGITAR